MKQLRIIQIGKQLPTTLGALNSKHHRGSEHRERSSVGWIGGRRLPRGGWTWVKVVNNMWDGDCWLEKEQASKQEVWLGKRVEVERVIVWLRKHEEVGLEERMCVEVQWGRNDLLGKGYLDLGHLWYQHEEFGLKEALEGYWPMNTLF